MYEKMAEINGLDMEFGVGQALFDDANNPKKRYFLEKRWDMGGKVLGAIMMNPSNAGAIENDPTIEKLIKYAKYNDFSALYIINIIPVIDSQSVNIKGKQDSFVSDDKQIKCFEYVLDNTDCIYIGWGRTGQKYLPILLTDTELKNKFLANLQKFFVTGISDKNFPYHPLQKRQGLPRLEENTKLKSASKLIESWIKEIDNK